MVFVVINKGSLRQNGWQSANSNYQHYQRITSMSRTREGFAPFLINSGAVFTPQYLSSAAYV
jgi:hypothetical protein